MYSAPPSMPEKSFGIETYQHKSFVAKKRRLLDLLLYLNCIFFVVWVTEALKPPVLLLLVLGLNGALITVWFAVLRPLTRIDIIQGTLCGRSEKGRKVSFPLRKVYLSKTLRRQSRFSRWCYKDIWSLEKQRIRFYRRALGQYQLRILMVMIQNYPFREPEPGAQP